MPVSTFHFSIPPLLLHYPNNKKPPCPPYLACICPVPRASSSVGWCCCGLCPATSPGPLLWFFPTLSTPPGFLVHSPSALPVRLPPAAASRWSPGRTPSPGRYRPCRAP